MYIQKDLNRNVSDTSADNGKSRQPYDQYLMLKRGKCCIDVTRKHPRKKDNRFEGEKTQDDGSGRKINISILMSYMETIILFNWQEKVIILVCFFFLKKTNLNMQTIVAAHHHTLTTRSFKLKG